ncbi:hypothetical protein [Xenophilus sp. Marseille-Q4582]|uniref:hypothetical protein n=1 Tax=Xenophilus sp. Marseille-Q4582 TaxID=2866600 RepID=UPI001CE428B8|nr:hypothetical protein [Xenophilus sp. Marseille-Q4582]
MAKKKSPTQRIERLEGIVVGAGFLLLKLKQQYGADFSVGMNQMVMECIRDCRQVESAREQRAASQATGEAQS